MTIRSILVIDHDPDTRTILGKMLPHQGHRCHVVEEVEAGVAVLEEHPIDIVFIEPCGEAEPVARIADVMSRQCEGPGCVLALTAWESPSAEELIREAGALRYILKPISLPYLEEVIREFGPPEAR